MCRIAKFTNSDQLFNDVGRRLGGLLGWILDIEGGTERQEQEQELESIYECNLEASLFQTSSLERIVECKFFGSNKKNLPH